MHILARATQKFGHLENTVRTNTQPNPTVDSKYFRKISLRWSRAVPLVGLTLFIYNKLVFTGTVSKRTRK
jgi:hypothetical protein